MRKEDSIVECKCGCGQIASDGKQYISGHNLKHLIRTSEHSRKISEAQTRAWREKRERMPIGSKNLDHCGYVRVKTKEGAGQWQKEHTLVMEQSLGRTLLPNESVHHINGIRNDNRQENLFLCRSKSEHKHIEDSCKRLVLDMLNKGEVKFSGDELRYELASQRH